MKMIHGVYLTKSEARAAVNELLDQGYKKDQIKVVCDTHIDRNFINPGMFGESKDEEKVEEDRNIWEKIKDSFTYDKYDDQYWDRELDLEERKLLEGYRPNLQAGEVVVLIR